ncbi:MAG: hypothetical protein FJ026_04450 [Chloroflexi bacterium]|nr:hypothetical protein [Chloroflexota bacterium]
MDRRTPGWAFVSIGLSIAAVQGLLIRLLLVSFSGNELSIGLVLGNWMLAEALGSRLGGHYADRFRRPRQALVYLQVAFALLLPLVVCAGYLVRRMAGTAPGEALGFTQIFWTSLLLLSPLSAVHGAMFSIGCAGRGIPVASGSASVGRFYACEALGAVCGGIVLTFGLVPHFNAVQSSLLLTLLGLATALLLLLSAAPFHHRQVWTVTVGLIWGLFLCVLVSPQALAAHRALVQLRWTPAFQVVYDHDSPYGNVAVTRLLSQYTFLANGVPVLTTPYPDITTVEETVHLPLLFHPNPQRVLVIGGGLGGLSSELLKYAPDRVDYAELDPLLIEVIRAFPTELTQQELQNPRLYVHTVDGRLFLNRMVRGEASAGRYDVVLVNLPYPSTLEINRFYTQEFFLLIRQVLDEQGLVVFTLPGSLSYIGEGVRNLNLMMRNGLGHVFANVHPIPGDTVLWLASQSLPLTGTPVPDLVSRWQERALPTRFITVEHLQVRLDKQRLAWFQDALQTDPGIRANHDLHPAGVLYGLGYWSEAFAPTTSRLLDAAGRIALWQWCFGVVFLTLAVSLGRRLWPRVRGVTIPVVVASTGFAGMVCDLTIVLVFQALYGCLYQQVGLIVAAFMAGLALGGWTMSRQPASERLRPGALIRLEIVLIAYWLLLPLLLTALATVATSLWVTPTLLLLNALGGALVGAQFALSSQLHASVRIEAGYTAGLLYAADLTGAFLGAVAVGIALLPVLGTVGTCLFVALLKICSLALVLTMPQTAHTPAIG